MNKVKIYLDTSVISHLEAEDTPEKMQDTLLFWQEIIKIYYKVSVSDLTLAELAKCPEPKRSQLFVYLSQIDYEEVEEAPEIIALAEEYIRHGVLSQKSRDDCRHIAIATIIGCLYIVSWNFKHFVNIRTINKVQAVNKLLDYNEINILPPSMMLKGEE
ncbi:twitching motility protein PilT [Desulfosporosinus sp. Tol-M]|nr:twitching motility protein PilT [Desulfosporosinus sp. Tol-M]